MHATHDRACLGQTPGDCGDRAWSKAAREKTTFFHSHLREAGLRFVNTDDIARELDISAYDAAELTNAVRRELVRLRESFVFETVFSDPVGDKLGFLTNAAAWRATTSYSASSGFRGPETSEGARCHARVPRRAR